MRKYLARALLVVGAIGLSAAWFGCRDQAPPPPQLGAAPVGGMNSPEDPPQPQLGIGGTGEAGVVPSTDERGEPAGAKIPGSEPTQLPDGTSTGAVGAPTTGNQGSPEPGRNQGAGLDEEAPEELRGEQEFSADPPRP